MLADIKHKVTHKIAQTIASLGLDPLLLESIELKPVPFSISSTWGYGTPVCYLLAKREADRRKPVSQRAQEIAEEIRSHFVLSEEFERVEAKNGYVNLYLNPAWFATQVIQEVVRQRDDYGRGEPKQERVMVEYSQPNTHKAFHIGHLRNACLGSALENILKASGYDVIAANYIGDVGLHVMKCLWCYLKFHQGKEPTEKRGEWLGEVYAEAAARVEYKNNVLKLVNDFVQLAYKDASEDKVFITAFNAFLGGLEAQGQYDQESLAFLRVLLITALELRFNQGADGRMLLAIFKEVEEEVKGEVQGRDGQKEVKKKVKTKVCQGELSDECIFWELWKSIGQWLQTMAPDFQGEPAQVETDCKVYRDLKPAYLELDQHREWWDQVDAWNREITEIFHRWDNKDLDFLALWERTKAWSMDDFLAIYDQLGIVFDVWFYESQVEEEGKQIVEELVAKRIAEDYRPNGGPVLANIDARLPKSDPSYGKEDYRTIAILRSDGTSLYSTKDLSLAKRKFEDYGVDRSIYVVDVRQSLYFKQIFKILELWGFPQASKCYHLAYEMVTSSTGKISSRTGNIILYRELVQEALEQASHIIEDKSPGLNAMQKAEISRVVALGALKFNMLNKDNNKVIVFDWDEALNFEGQAAPYIQYAHARACRILEKAGYIPDGSFDFSHLAAGHAVGEVALSGDTSGDSQQGQAVEVTLVDLISRYPDEVARAADQYKPVILTAYLYELAEAFNNFYHDCPVLKAETKALRQARLGLTFAAKQTIRNGLNLLGIEAPEYM